MQSRWGFRIASLHFDPGSLFLAGGSLLLDLTALNPRHIQRVLLDRCPLYLGVSSLYTSLLAARLI